MAVLNRVGIDVPKWERVARNSRLRHLRPLDRHVRSIAGKRKRLPSSPFIARPRHVSSNWRSRTATKEHSQLIDHRLLLYSSGAVSVIVPSAAVLSVNLLFPNEMI